MIEHSYGIRYWALATPGADPGDEASWVEAVFIFESKLEAVTTHGEWVRHYSDNPDIRNIQVVRTPKPKWEVVEEEEDATDGN